jgi:pimeloyl-ACP methyl ester carboxylesterase
MAPRTREERHVTRHKVMERAPVDGIELEYEVRGTGERVVLMHAGVCADFFAPLLEQPALVDRYAVVSYHRAGYAGSGRLAGALSFVRQAAHCRALMQHLGIERAHVVGHSSSASMALQLALDAADAVQSLALLEPARPATPSPVQQEMVKAIVEPALGRYGAGDRAGAIDTWMRGVCGPDYRALLERAVPGAFEQAVADADTFFGQEMPAVQQWSFGPAEADRIAQPVLVVAGEHSIPVFHERRDLLLAWLPNAESFELPQATHLLQVQDPRGVAEALAAFFSRHPAPAP